jgi:hypothetical protein
MREDELKTWLRGSYKEPIPGEQVAALLGVDAAALTGATRRSLAFVVAVLRDTYIDEVEVWLWFVRPCQELSGSRPADLLAAGRVGELEALAVQRWNLRSQNGELDGIMLGVTPLAETSVPAKLQHPNRRRIASAGH